MEIVNVPYGVLMPNVSFGELFTVLPILCVLLARYDGNGSDVMVMMLMVVM